MLTKPDQSLLEAAENGDADTLRQLLRAAANPTPAPKTGIIALIWKAARPWIQSNPNPLAMDRFDVGGS